MLEGIEILAQTEIMKPASWIWIVIAAGLTLLAIGVVFITIGSLILDDAFIASGGIMIICSVVILFVSIPLSEICQKPTGRYEYKVTIGENISFTELYEKYEVIGQDGKIWTIRDKE